MSTETDLYLKTKCRYCKSSLGAPFLNLGTMPLANSFLTKEQAREKEFVCPLSLVWCSRCGLVQLTHVVPPELMFSNYLYVSSTTQAFQRHFAAYAQTAKEKFGSGEPRAVAVDIGSNDGLLLACYQKEGLKAVGVEPAVNLSREANQKGLTTINDYFSSSAVRQILQDFGPADIVSANNVFAHIDDIHSVCRNASTLLSPRGIFIIEFPYLVTMFEQMFFDMIYHEHLSYLAVSPLKQLLAGFDLEIFDIDKVDSHGGSLRVFIQKKTGARPVSPGVSAMVEEEMSEGYGSSSIYEDFAMRVYRVREELTGFVAKIKTEGKTLCGYGAPAKGNTLINFCGFNASQIDYLVDDNPLKQNLLAPGSRIPVVSSKQLFEKPTDCVILFAWNFAEEILRKLEPLRQRGVRFMIPLPRPRVL